MWSTPNAVIRHVENCLVQIQPGDRVCDVGCGDGRVILHWAANYSSNLSKQHLVRRLRALTPPEDTPRQDEEEKEVDATMMPSFVGIDIDEERISQAVEGLKRALDEGKIHEKMSITFRCTNALDCSKLYSSCNVFFLYLIPRGLKLIKPLILQQQPEKEKEEKDYSSSTKKPNIIKVLTYMSPFEDETPVRMEKIEVPHQPGSHWPVYLYELTRGNASLQDQIIS